MTVKIKICGITRVEDAVNASKLGADALGFVFVENTPRYISPSEASIIMNKIPPFVNKIGLFVNPQPKDVEKAKEVCNFNLIQFHGDESPSFCEQFNLPYIKAISVKEGINLLEYEYKYNTASAFLLDTFSQKVRGGSGKTFDWNLIPKNLSKPIVVAGGLRKENLVELFKVITPYAVDVSSGVESGKGIKEYQMMKDFILGVKNASL